MESIWLLYSIWNFLQKKNVFWLFPFLFGPPYAAQADYYKSEWVGIFNRQAVFLVEMKKKVAP